LYAVDVLCAFNDRRCQRCQPHAPKGGDRRSDEARRGV